jgi:dihydroflavonol-4-reductase
MILVTGATGHLGNVLVRELCSKGEKVRVFILPNENCVSLSGSCTEIVEGNILDESSLNQAMQGVDVVFHLAALVSIIPGQEHLLRKINVEGTKNVIHAATKAGVKRLVYTSSIHALARPDLGVTISEKLPFDTHNPAGAYDRTKAEASIAVLEAVNNGLDAVIVCPTGVIGPHDYRRSEMGELILDWMGRKANLIIEGFFDFVDVRDVALGHILASQQGKRGETYILGGYRVQIQKMCQQVKDLAGIKSPIIKIPHNLALFLTHFTQGYYQLTKTRPKFTRYAIETLVSNSQISIEKARNDLGYTPRPLLSTLRDTVLWWYENRMMVKATLRL